MSSTTSWTCLEQSSRRAFISTSNRSLGRTFQPNGSRIAFSTTANLSAAPAKPAWGAKQGPIKRGEGQTFRKKSKLKDSLKDKKAPAPGERKALRKRIVLSNTNALEVKDMPDLSANAVTNSELVGRVVNIPGPVIDQLRAVEAFKTTQAWKLFRQPAMLVRQETLWYGKQFEETGNEVRRRIIVGDRASGKSLMLLQAMSLAFLKKWVVIHIPEAQDLVNGHTDYAPIIGTMPLQYQQKTYTAALLTRIAKANAEVLKDLRLSLSHDLPIPIQPNISLDRFALLGGQDPELAHPIFQALWAELIASSTEKHPRPRILLTLDGLGFAMKESHYRTPAFETIHAHSLALVDWFMTHLSGKSTLPNGGMVLAATGESNHPSVPTLVMRLKQIEAQQIDLHSRPASLVTPFLEATGQATDLIPEADAFYNYDERVIEVLKNDDGKLEVRRMTGLSKQEARGLMEYWAKSGLMRKSVSEGLVGEKWSLSGGGIVGELERGCVRMRI